ncbi:unnamed protein product [Gongylonema pulchrum]|uniref:Uncharacterized protein n=1 Tax=Gongylonema pulchrum TaxID=637853 RepID=A0A183EXW5_9BILA|nr:unnamed protein product [Gongylonema pulchrum]
MENELTENPFRPQETLFHEVDPIVEAYKRKPYPPSLPGSQNTTPVKTANQAYLNGKFNSYNKLFFDVLTHTSISPTALIADKELEKPMIADSAALTSSTPLMSNDDRPLEDGGDDLPKARHVECVRIEKKKCGCCSVQ